MFVAISSSICGITEWDDMEDYAIEKIEWFRKFYPYKNGIPSHDTISRLFAKLCPTEFCKYFTEWVKSLRKNIDKEVIAIDGKAVKGSAQKSKGIKSLYFVSAYASENELVLGQEIVDEKSNEITAVPKLLDLIECKNTIITVDALNTQTQIAKKVIEKLQLLVPNVTGKETAPRLTGVPLPVSTIFWAPTANVPVPENVQPLVAVVVIE